MSIGSETKRRRLERERVRSHNRRSSRWSGAPASDTGDFNGIRVEVDESRGGLVKNISFKDVCTRDVINAIVRRFQLQSSLCGNAISAIPVYCNPYFHGVTCKGLLPSVVDLQGFSAQYPAGPIVLDNVVVEGITALDVAAQFSNVNARAGCCEFSCLSERTSPLSDHVVGSTTPIACAFPPLPVPQ